MYSSIRSKRTLGLCGVWCVILMHTVPTDFRGRACAFRYYSHREKKLRTIAIGGKRNSPNQLTATAVPLTRYLTTTASPNAQCDQGFTRSHWMQPLGKCLHHNIAPGRRRPPLSTDSLKTKTHKTLTKHNFSLATTVHFDHSLFVRILTAEQLNRYKGSGRNKILPPRRILQ